MASPLGSILAALLEAGDAELKVNSGALLAAANAAGIKVIDEIATAIIASLPTHGIAAVVAPFIRAGITNAEPQIIAALDGEEAALLALAESEIAKVAAGL